MFYDTFCKIWARIHITPTCRYHRFSSLLFSSLLFSSLLFSSLLFSSLLFSSLLFSSLLFSSLLFSSLLFSSLLIWRTCKNIPYILSTGNSPDLRSWLIIFCASLNICLIFYFPVNKWLQINSLVPYNYSLVSQKNYVQVVIACN